MVVSSRNSDPVGAFKKLYEASSSAAPIFASRPYVDPTIMRYYVLLHDASAPAERGSLQRSESVLESIKKNYGLNCSLVTINSASKVEGGEGMPREISKLWEDAIGEEDRVRIEEVALDGDEDISRDPTSPRTHMTRTSVDTQGRPAASALPGDRSQKLQAKQYGSTLSESDIDGLKSFFRVFVAQSLIPWMERSAQQWNTQISESRKGLTNRLFGAGRSLFGRAAATAREATGGGSGASGGAYNVQTGSYQPSSTEALTRRLADFAFILHDYTLATSTYDQARKDFANDKAYLHAASAFGMLGLSQLMAHLSGAAGSSKQALNPLESEAHLASSRLAFDQATAAAGGSSGTALIAGEEQIRFAALKSTILYYEAFRELRAYASASSALRRGAETSVDEITSAMLLEQSALMNLRRSKGNGTFYLPTGKNAAPSFVEQPPALRRAAIEFVAAAHAYRQCGQRQLAARCFESAYSWEGGKAWAAMDCHLERQLLQQAQQSEKTVQESIQHLLQLLKEGYGTPDEQAAFLDQLNAQFESALKTGNAQVGDALDLAQGFFDVQTAAIVSNGDGVIACFGTGSEDESREAWESLQESFLRELRGSKQFGEVAQKRMARLEVMAGVGINSAQTGGELAYHDIMPGMNHAHDWSPLQNHSRLACMREILWVPRRSSRS